MMKNTEEHAELISGNLVIINYTSPAHNSVVGDMYLSFREFIKKNNGNCKVFSENVALFCNELSDETKNEFYLPDLMVVCDEEGIKDDGVHTAPLFVAEVTSDSTRKYDYAPITYLHPDNVSVSVYDGELAIVFSEMF